jgi:hypothetical protein
MFSLVWSTSFRGFSAKMLLSLFNEAFLPPGKSPARQREEFWHNIFSTCLKILLATVIESVEKWGQKCWPERFLEHQSRQIVSRAFRPKYLPFKRVVEPQPYHWFPSQKPHYCFR